MYTEKFKPVVGLILKKIFTINIQIVQMLYMFVGSKVFIEFCETCQYWYKANRNILTAGAM